MGTPAAVAVAVAVVAEEGPGGGRPQEALPWAALPRCAEPCRAAPLRPGAGRGDGSMSWLPGSRGVVLTAYHPSGGGGAPGG